MIYLSDRACVNGPASWDCCSGGNYARHRNPEKAGTRYPPAVALSRGT